MDSEKFVCLCTCSLSLILYVSKLSCLCGTCTGEPKNWSDDEHHARQHFFAAGKRQQVGRNRRQSQQHDRSGSTLKHYAIDVAVCLLLVFVRTSIFVSVLLCSRSVIMYFILYVCIGGRDRILKPTHDDSHSLSFSFFSGGQISKLVEKLAR